MKQYIYVQATAATIVNGIVEFKKLVGEQTAVKPEVYLPIISYLERYAKELLPQKKEDKKNDASEIPIRTTVVCNNAKILEDYKKVENFLYNQTKIKPEVYLHIIDKIEDFVDILREQERQEYKKVLASLEEPKQEEKKKQKTKNEDKDIEKENETDENEIATKNDDMNLSKLKKFM